MSDIKEAPIEPTDKATKIGEVMFMGMQMEGLTVPEMYAALVIAMAQVVLNFSPTRADALHNVDTVTSDLRETIDGTWEPSRAAVASAMRGGGTEH